VLRHAGTGARRIILDSKQEAAHEKYDRVWRRWSDFCDAAGIADNKSLVDVPKDASELISQTFLSLYRTAAWDKSGSLVGERRHPVVGGTVRDAASQLATAFRDHYQRSPLHGVKGSTKLLPSVRALLRAFDKVDQPQNRQRAVTPKFLKALLAYCQATYARESIQCHPADLIMVAFFFAMRTCEYTRTARPGRTKVAVVKYVIFRDRIRRVLSHRDPELQNKAYFITLVFADQKNGKKLDARTQQRTGDPFLCPVICWAAII
jgi:hypothetical protein